MCFLWELDNYKNKTREKEIKINQKKKRKTREKKKRDKIRYISKYYTTTISYNLCFHTIELIEVYIFIYGAIFLEYTKNQKMKAALF